MPLVKLQVEASCGSWNGSADLEFPVDLPVSQWLQLFYFIFYFNEKLSLLRLLYFCLSSEGTVFISRSGIISWDLLEVLEAVKTNPVNYFASCFFFLLFSALTWCLCVFFFYYFVLSVQNRLRKSCCTCFGSSHLESAEKL